MALSFQSVQKAYQVFGVLKREYGIPERIPSWPTDLQEDSELKKDPKESVVYGFDKKHDDGWENLVFFISNPPEGFKERFLELATLVPNSTFSSEWKEGSPLWLFGWF